MKIIPLKPKQDNPSNEVLEQLVKFSGIPKEVLETELQSILVKKNLRLEDLTLDQLRSVAAAYARQIVRSVLSS